jgi:alpha-L-fucosidase
MFKTKASDWNIVQATPYGKDILKPLAAACRKYGIKLGFYYSQAQDWNNGGAECSGSWDPAQKHDMDDYINKIVIPQVKELLTHYGKFPAVLWWDTPCDMNQERAAKIAALLKLKPNIITNNRLGGFSGDYETPEQTIPANGFPGHDWETCMTINNTWGYKLDDHDWKSADTLLRNLIDIASKGGNYLLNVGPDATGVISQPEVQRLKQMGAWLKINGQAIYGTVASPFKEQLAWGRCTQKESKDGTILYLTIFNWPSDGKLIVPDLTDKVVSSTLLENGTKLQSTATANGLIISVPTNAPDSIASVIKVVIKK